MYVCVYIYFSVCILCFTKHRELNPVFCDNLEGWDGAGDGRKVQEEGDYEYLWLIRVDVWKRPTQFRKAIILQLKKSSEMTEVADKLH